ncbi:T9SS type A sorting domain-containing protein [bacterium]|nr:T9SS type A sorting domain-containing protein [bacterium]
MRYTIITVLSIIILQAVGLEGNLYAKEWSDEVRLTNAESNFINYWFEVDVDSRNDIHLMYEYNGYCNEDYNRSQAVIQKFNRFGEALTDPVIIGETVDLPDTAGNAYDIFIDSDDNIYILWGERNLHVTKFNRDYEVIINDAYLEGTTIRFADSRPQMVVDSEGNIIVIARVYNPEIPIDQRRSYVVYGRYSDEGELIDTLQILQEENSIYTSLYVEITSEDTLHLAWKKNNPNNSVHYSKVSPDGEFIIDNFQLPFMDWDAGIGLGCFFLDNNNNPLFTIHDSIRLHLKRYNNDLEEDINAYIATCELRWGDIYVDNAGNIHIVEGFDDDSYNDSRRFIGYIEFNEEGEIIDSLQIVHDARMNGDYGRTALWSMMELFAINDSTVGVIWNDDRFRQIDTGIELMMRYSVSNNGIDSSPPVDYSNSFRLLPNYPNPFNNQVSISYQIPVPGNVKLRIYDVRGRLVEQLVDSHAIAGEYKTIWKSQTSGIYLILLQTETASVVKKVVCVK